MRLIGNPVVQFLAVGALTLLAVAVGTGSLSRSAANDEAIEDARVLTRVLGRSVAEPAITPALVAGDPEAVAEFDRTTLPRLLVEDVRRIKIWIPDGHVIFSDEDRLIGQSFGLASEEDEVLEEGGLEAEMSDLSRPENQYERGIGGGLLEVYTRIESPDGEPLLFEAYYSVAEIEQQRERVLSRFRPITLGALLVLVAVTTPLLFLLTRRLTRAGTDRERLLESAVLASDAERVRIARDLHDGVVQDLAGSSYALSTLSTRRDLPPEAADDLHEIGRSLRTSMRSLRSLLIEIYPPDLHTAGLAAALTDLLAPVEAAGVRTSLEVSERVDAPPEVTALVWRVAQEAVRNVVRHASATELTVEVRRTEDQMTLLVSDDGVGFDPDEALADHGFGLRGLRSLVHDAGGRLDVASSPGWGALVRLEVPL